VGFDATQDEVLTIFKDFNAHKTGYLPMDDFYQRLDCWKNYSSKKDVELQNLRDQADKLV